MAESIISYLGFTDVGRVRENNEDTFIAEPLPGGRRILLAAIDGMGGEEGGEVAAEIARNTMVDFLRQNSTGNALGLIKRALVEANNEIVRQRHENPQYSRMGCVITAGLADTADGTMAVAHVGDSRLYRFSQNELTKLTHDHSLVGYQEEQGILTEEEAMKHPRRSIINRSVGHEIHNVDDPDFIEAGNFPLFDGDTFLFCSDGLSDMATSHQIAECLSCDSLEAACHALIDAANRAGGKDNITVVAARVHYDDNHKFEDHPTSIIIDQPQRQEPETDDPYTTEPSELGDTTVHGHRAKSGRSIKSINPVIAFIAGIILGAAVTAGGAAYFWPDIPTVTINTDTPAESTTDLDQTDENSKSTAPAKDSEESDMTDKTDKSDDTGSQQNPGEHEDPETT